MKRILISTATLLVVFGTIALISVDLSAFKKAAPVLVSEEGKTISSESTTTSDNKHHS